MTLLVKDANTQIQQLGTQPDASGALVAEHLPCALVAGIAVPASAAAPLPVINAAGAAALDGSGAIAAAGVAQMLFGGVVPTNGYLVANNSSATLYVCDVGTASAGGASIPIGPAAVFMTPAGYRPGGAVSIYGGTIGQAFAARRW